MKKVLLILFAIILSPEKGWTEDLEEPFAEETKNIQIVDILSYLKDSDLASFKARCNNDPRKMVDLLFYSLPYLNKTKEWWYHENNCVNDFVVVPMREEEAWKCASFKLKAYYWLIKISNGMMDDDDSNICVFYENETPVYDMGAYYDYRNNKKTWVYLQRNTGLLDKKFRNWYEAVKHGGFDKAQTEMHKINYKTTQDNCKWRRLYKERQLSH